MCSQLQMKKNYKKNKIDGSSYKTVIYLLAAKYAVVSVNNDYCGPYLSIFHT